MGGLEECSGFSGSLLLFWFLVAPGFGVGGDSSLGCLEYDNVEEDTDVAKGFS